MKKSGITLILIIITSLCSFGQLNKRQREYSGFFDTYYYRGPITYTIGAGMSTYRGDLTKTYTQGLSYAFSAGANYKLWPHTVFGADLTYIHLHSTDGVTTRNISFNTSGFELQAYGRLYIIDEIVRIAQDRKKEKHYTFCKPYIQAGVGLYNYHAKGLIENPSTLLKSGESSATLTSGGLAFVIPAGAGVQFSIDQRSSLCLEYIYRFTLTDNLDTYAYGKNDGYGIAMVKFQYAPSAPKKKKKMSTTPPAQYDGPKGTETWKTKKQQEVKPQEEYVPVPETNTNTEENTPTEEVVPEEVEPK